MLFYSVFQTFHRKNDSLKSLNPEGPLGSYCVTSFFPLFDHMSVSFLWNKESQKDLLPGEKNLILLSFLRFMFLFPVFFCSFIIPFTEDSVFFLKSIFNFLLLLIVDLCHMFSGLFFHSFAVFVIILKHHGIIIQNTYFVLLVPGFLLVRSVITGLEYLGSCRQMKTLFC